jgi:hypothetical protein
VADFHVAEDSTDESSYVHDAPRRSVPPLSHAREELPFTRGRINQFTVLNDGTAVILRRISGHLDKARRAIEVHPSTVSYSVSGDSEGDGLAYVHTEPPESIAAVIDLPHEHEVVFDFPLEGIDAGTIRASMIGETNATLRQALAAIPEEITVTVERIGAYPADASDLSRLLTD